MVLSVYTNLPSLQAQRWLQQSTSALQRATRRLSSGQRINEAADDISGMALSVGLRTEMRSAAWVGRNVVDGTSLLGQADSAMAQQTEILQQIRERALQAASDNINIESRKVLDEDVAQLKSELDHIARNTTFNGMQLLDGSFDGRSLMIGTSTKNEENMGISIGGTTPSTLGGTKSTPDVFENDIYQNASGARIIFGGWAMGEVTLRVGSQTTSVPPPAGNTAKDYAATFNAIQATTGVTAEALTLWPFINAQTTLATSPGDVAINGVPVPPFQNQAANDTGPGSAVAAINSVESQTGVCATLGAGDHITLTAADGRDITVAVNDNGALATGVWTTTTTGHVCGGLKFKSSQSFTLGDTSGADVSNGHPGMSVIGIAGTTSTATQTVIGATSHVSDIDLKSRQGALLAIQIADQAMAEICGHRSLLGAASNRLNNSKAALDVATEMAAAAESRIIDADYAVETTMLSKGQIMQQVGIAVLSQANMHPQLVLSLLKGN